MLYENSERESAQIPLGNTITVSECLLSKALLRKHIQGFLPWEPVLETPGHGAGLAPCQAARDSWQCLPCHTDSIRPGVLMGSYQLQENGIKQSFPGSSIG